VRLPAPPCIVAFPTGATITSRLDAVFIAKNKHVKHFFPLILVVAATGAAAAQPIPLPRPRPAAPASVAPASQEAPSACRLRLTDDLAIAPSIPTLNGPGECGVQDVVRLEAVVLQDGSRVPLTPPATLRCSMAEAIAHWVREDVVPAVQSFGAPLRSVDNYASYDCRGRNNIAGAPLSEHGRANALDIRSVRLANGKVIGLTDPHVPHDFREGMRKSVCARFSTVLGPGSDGYHEDHVHVDLRERARGRFAMCQWEVRDPVPVAEATARVPLPPPRPKFDVQTGKKF
jgi:hypothetical protein